MSQEHWYTLTYMSQKHWYTLTPFQRAIWRAAKLAGMTQERWCSLTSVERELVRDTSELESSPLHGHQDRRIEVIRMDGTKARFRVGVSSGWRPIYLEYKRIDSNGGAPADKAYQSVRRVLQRNQRR